MQRARRIRVTFILDPQSLPRPRVLLVVLISQPVILNMKKKSIVGKMAPHADFAAALRDEPEAVTGEP